MFILFFQLADFLSSISLQIAQNSRGYLIVVLLFFFIVAIFKCILKQMFFYKGTIASKVSCNHPRTLQGHLSH